MSAAAPRPSHQADRTRKAILRAAIREFSGHGLAGARTDRIADSAQVNKALLYYYFKSKSHLYGAALEEVSEAAVKTTLTAFDLRYSAGERLLRVALNHFDRILTQREFQSLMQQEMVRFRRGQSESMQLLVNKAFRPLLEKLQETIREGIQAGELCEADWLQVVYSMLGANVFYFLSAPMLYFATRRNPLSNSAIASRRKSSLRFLGNAIFVDRAYGVKLARRVLNDIPLPRIKNNRIWGTFS